jgi:Domain of unknown function (DUF4337)
MGNVLEHAEHTTHAAHGGDHGKYIGLTMAVIGVLVAVCAALVGGSRNEMMRAMIEQTQASGDATSASTKYRVILVNIENMRTQSAEQMNPAVRDRFVRLYSDYAAERKISSEWAASYAPLINAHFDATEGYERAQLIAEVGIILASLAVLLSNKPAWYVSIALGLISVGQIGVTYARSHATISQAEVRVEHSSEAYKNLRASHVGDKSDDEAVAALDPSGALLKKLQNDLAQAMAHAAEGHDEAHH